jgi:hypothetical protein
MFLRTRDFQEIERLDRPPPPGSRPHVARSGNTIVVADPQPGLPIPLIVSKTRGATFEPVDLPSGVKPLRAVTHGQDKFLAVGEAGTILHSVDGQKWARSLSPVDRDLLDVMYAGDQWVAVGADGTIVVSADGLSFTKSASRTESSLNGVAYGDGAYIVVGASGTILRSTNGREWLETDRGEHEWLRVTYGNGRFVAVGASGLARVSGAGTEWTDVRVSDGTLRDIAYAEGIFLAAEAGTEKGYSSEDGITWTTSTVPQGTVSLSSSAGDVWLSSTNLYGNWTLWQARLKRTFEIALQPRIETNGLFTLAFDAPTGGLYSVQSSDDPAKLEWQSETILQRNFFQELSWTYPHRIKGTRFFRVRQLE